MDKSVLPKPPGSEPEWGIDQLDLDAYLSRVGYDGPRTTTVDTLRRLHRAHAGAVTWEIIDLLTGRPVGLDLKSVQRKIVEDRQGGSCLESNMLFAAALERLGFPVVRHVSRVRRGSDKVRTRSHLVLLTEIDGQLWFCDPGFGDETPLEPLRFENGATVTVGDWSWRLDQVGQDGEEWVLRCEHADGWFDVYSLHLEVQHMVDYDMIKTFSYTDPNSVFVGRLVVQLGSEKERLVLKDNTLVTQWADGRTETVELTGDEILRTLREKFHLTLRDEDARELAQRF
jgi:N-hydroxyarylamine O-acetyltransferase